MKNNKFRVGIVGTGHIANSFHIPAWKKNKFSKLVSLCDIDKKKLKIISKKFNIRSIYTNLEKMIKKEKLDILCICTPPYLHYKNIVKGIKNDCDVLVEKPLVIKNKEALNLIKLVKQKKVNCICAMHQRYRPISNKIKQILDKKILGKIYFIKILKYQSNGVPTQSKIFSNRKQSGGGPLIDIGTHYFDLICWYLNFPKIQNVKAKNFNNLSKLSKNQKKTLPFKTFNSEEFTIGNINFKNNISINYEISYLLNIEKDETMIQIFGDKGSVTWPNGELLLRDKNGKLKKSKIKVKENKKASQIQIDSFVKGKIKKTKTLKRLKESYYIVKLVNALYKSALTNSEVSYEK
jgi:predicted dehydrogenase